MDAKITLQISFNKFRTCYFCPRTLIGRSVNLYTLKAVNLPCNNVRRLLPPIRADLECMTSSSCQIFFNKSFVRSQNHAMNNLFSTEVHRKDLATGFLEDC